MCIFVDRSRVCIFGLYSLGVSGKFTYHMLSMFLYTRVRRSALRTRPHVPHVYEDINIDIHMHIHPLFL